ncbi:MAG: hypothetical protein LBN94_00420, partial [Puniceicoccales bacterium]|nr:hypothetical protein [Puniceicoccales bacterium]
MDSRIWGERLGSLLINGELRSTEFSPALPLEIAETNGYYEENGTIVFALFSGERETLSKKKFFLAGDINGWLSAGQTSRWELKPAVIGGCHCLALEIPKGKLPSHFQFKFVSQDWEWQPLPRFCRNIVIPSPNLMNLEYRGEKTGQHMVKFSLRKGIFALGDFAELIGHNQRIAIDDERLLDSLYSDEKLGAYVENGTTYFALFAPRVSGVSVLWKRDLGGEYQNRSMEKEANGIWKTQWDQDLTNGYYLFRIQRRENGIFFSRDVVDPYARALVSRNGPGIVVPTQEVAHHFQGVPLEKLVIYEGHVRDLITKVREIPDVEKLGFRGLTKFLEHHYLQNLGINAIELQPIQEFDGERQSDYHWGYMPINYFAPASAYGSEPEKGSQVGEFKDLVEAFHRHNISVILDVVYNHVGEPNHLHMIDEKYFFRRNDDGFLLNYSGCGNDLATERPMVRKLIRDSLEYLLRTYDVDGFRFDLAELVGLEFLDELRLYLQRIKPSLIMIAEPWSFRSYVGHDVRKTQLLAWNDEYRNFIRDYILGHGNWDGLRYFVEGSLKFRSKFPAQSVNYLSSHDDLCWIDSITAQINRDASMPALIDWRRTHMALAILLLSLGVPMVAAATELLHSKGGVSNTYQRGDLNAIDYTRAWEYPLTLGYLENLIHLRMESSLFCLKKTPSENYN